MFRVVERVLAVFGSVVALALSVQYIYELWAQQHDKRKFNLIKGEVDESRSEGSEV